MAGSGAGEQPAVFQFVDDLADGGAVIGDKARDGGLIDAGMQAQGGQYRELHRRQRQAERIHPFKEQPGRYLVEPPDQVAWHRVDFHLLILTGFRITGKYAYDCPF